MHYWAEPTVSRATCVSNSTHTPMAQIDETTPAGDLIQRYQNDLWYDCHRLPARIGRSDARKELQRRGPVVLKPIGSYLSERFPIGKLSELGNGYADDFVAWGHLLYGIINDHKIADIPYEDTPYSDQDMSVWVAFCFRNAVA